MLGSETSFIASWLLTWDIYESTTWTVYIKCVMDSRMIIAISCYDPCKLGHLQTYKRCSFHPQVLIAGRPEKCNFWTLKNPTFRAMVHDHWMSAVWVYLCCITFGIPLPSVIPVHSQTSQCRDKYNFGKVIRQCVRQLPEIIGHGKGVDKEGARGAEAPPQFLRFILYLLLLYIVLWGRISACMHLTTSQPPHYYKLVYAPAWSDTNFPFIAHHWLEDRWILTKYTCNWMWLHVHAAQTLKPESVKW